ncbi:MAG: VanZ family protein [Chitinophagaceae bacterium]
MKEQWPEKIIVKIFLRSLGLLYAAGLIYIFFFARRRWRFFPTRNINLVPFRDKINYLQTNAIRVNPYNWEFYKDLFGNILLFVPFPLLVSYFFGIKSFRKLFLVSAGTSLLVEVTQYIFNIGVSDIDDLLLNTLGASIGLLILYLFLRLRTNQSPLETRSHAPGKMNYSTITTK